MINSGKLPFEYNMSNSIFANKEELIIGVPKKLLATKTCDRYVAGAGEELTYQLILKNNQVNGNVRDLVIIDTIPKNTSLVSGSIEVNGNKYPDKEPVTITIPTLSNIEKSNTATITYKVKIADKLCNASKIENEGYIYYDALDSSGNFKKEVKSTKAFTNLKSTEVRISKFADKQIVAVGDSINYVISIVNTGNEKVSDVILIEEIPIDLAYIGRSLKVDGEYADDKNLLSINIGVIKPNEKKVIIYQAEVLSTPLEEEIMSASIIKYKLIIDKETDRVGEYKIESNTVITEVMASKCNRYYYYPREL